MKYIIKITNAALKDTKALPIKVSEKLWDIIASLESNPHPLGAKKLKTESNLWRIRSGNYRIIYQMCENELIVLVVAVGHRKDVYKHIGR